MKPAFFALDPKRIQVRALAFRQQQARMICSIRVITLGLPVLRHLVDSRPGRSLGFKVPIDRWLVRWELGDRGGEAADWNIHAVLWARMFIVEPFGFLTWVRRG